MWLEPPRTGTVGDISWVPRHSRTTRDAHAVQDSTMALGTRLLPSPPAACGAIEERCAVGTGVAGAIPQPPARGDPLYPLALTLCPAPFPQGFPPSQPVPPGGRESRATDSPRSPRPAESKVGTGLGARRSCAHVSPGAPEPRAPSPSHRQLPGWGLSPCPPLLPPLLSEKRSPAADQPLPPPALTNSLLLARVPAGGTVRVGSPPLASTASFSHLRTRRVPSNPSIHRGRGLGTATCRRCFGRVYKSVAEQPPCQHPSARPCLASLQQSGRQARGGGGVPGFSWGQPASSLP